MTGPPPETGFFFPGAENLHKDIYPAITASSTPSLKQSGKIVLITGAGRGIGRAISIQYAHAGVAAIILIARTASQLDEVEIKIQKVDSKIVVKKLSVDVSDDSAVHNAAETVKQEFGRLDVLINNAGAGPAWTPLADSTPKTWWQSFEVNLKGPYLFTHAFLPLLTETVAKFDTFVYLINVTSIGATIALPTSSAYNIAKAALVRLTDFTHVEYAAKGVVAVSVHPGAVETDLSKDIEMIKASLNDTPDLCGGAVVWLTAEKREWLAGRYFAVTWDVEKLESMKEEIVQGDKLKLKLVI